MGGQGGGILVLGHESRGLSDEIAMKCTHRLTLERRGHAESLNLVTAAAVFAHALTAIPPFKGGSLGGVGFGFFLLPCSLFLPKMITVDIGLLWGEAQITGELRGDFAVEGWTDCNRKFDLDRVSGAFSAFLPPTSCGGAGGGESESPHSDGGTKGGLGFAIRLAECFSPESAARVLNHVPTALSGDGVDVLEAGRMWQTGSQTFDNRVWWPVVKLASRGDAEPLLTQLRTVAALNPFGFTVVPLSESELGSPPTSSGGTKGGNLFACSLNDLSTQLIRLTARPLSDSARFALHHVPIGRGFHWERKETLEYRGALRIFGHPSVHGGAGGGLALTASNRLPLEHYLESAVGSEMRSDLPPAFSQAQAIAARSTVLATANRHHRADGFDLCNDDHCQCYQGVSREATAVVAPIRESAGRVLVTDTSFIVHRSSVESESASSLIPHPSSLRIVDARYAKSCGGISERYEACWGEDDHPYFAVRACGDFPVPDLTDEKNARAFVLSHPPAWCDGQLHPYPEPWDKDPLYRWKFRYTRVQLGELIARKTGANIGSVQSLEVRKRAASGRILILKIQGSASDSSFLVPRSSLEPASSLIPHPSSLTLYGELNIRRALSPSHLPSSCFVVDEVDDQITLTGGGWGHGVGLCQLGAAAMAKAGRTVEQILDHYYPGSELAIL
ncbi:hypothetical protein HZB60_11315 [candidate division KSB1 bacterium]|nr:hypothetical protein [candidate division KSB1 bacterium]